MKNPLTQAGIEPATVRFVALHRNHCATAVPAYTSSARIFEESSDHFKILGAELLIWQVTNLMFFF